MFKIDKLRGELNESHQALSREREIHESNILDLQSKFESQISIYDEKLMTIEVQKKIFKMNCNQLMLFLLFLFLFQE